MHNSGTLHSTLPFKRQGGREGLEKEEEGRKEKAESARAHFLREQWAQARRLSFPPDTPQLFALFFPTKQTTAAPVTMGSLRWSLHAFSPQVSILFSCLRPSIDQVECNPHHESLASLHIIAWHLEELNQTSGQNLL